MDHRILVASADPASRIFLRQCLEGGGYHVVTADRPEAALAALAEGRMHLVLLELAGAIGGLSLCRRLRADAKTASLPVILTCTGNVAEQVEGLEQGADEVLCLPLPARLVLARVGALLRRAPCAAAAERKVKAGPLVIDRQGRVATIAGKFLPLTRKEFDLLCLLVERRGRVLGAPFLLETVWGYDTSVYKDPHTIEVHVSSLRRKLGPRLSRRIVNVPGLGYRFDKSLN